FDVLEVMHASNPCFGIIVALKTPELLCMPTGFKGLHDRFEPAGTFGVILPGIVLEVIRMIDQTNVHTLLLEQSMPKMRLLSLVYCPHPLPAMRAVWQG